jgi:hypothetical protein
MSRRAAIGLVVAGVLVFETLNFTGFCYSRGRWLDDQELIDAVIQHQIDHIGPEQLASGAIKYTSVEGFHRLNPVCCKLAKWGDPYYPFWRRRPMVWVRRILGQEILIVDLWYRFRDDGPEPFTTAHYLIDACGNVREPLHLHGGSANTRTGPTRTWAEGP